MNLSISFLLTILSFFYMGHSFACDMPLPDVEKETKGLERLAAPALGLAEKNILSVEASDLQAFYIWEDPMCPEGIKAKATYKIIYKSSDSLVKNCHGKVFISKTYPTPGENIIPVKHKYEIEILEEANCLN